MEFLCSILCNFPFHSAEISKQANPAQYFFFSFVPAREYNAPEKHNSFSSHWAVFLVNSRFDDKECFLVFFLTWFLKNVPKESHYVSSCPNLEYLGTSVQCLSVFSNKLCVFKQSDILETCAWRFPPVLYNKHSKINKSYQAQILIPYHYLFDLANTSVKLLLTLSKGRRRENGSSKSSYSALHSNPRYFCPVWNP